LGKFGTGERKKPQQSAGASQHRYSFGGEHTKPKRSCGALPRAVLNLCNSRNKNYPVWRRRPADVVFRHLAPPPLGTSSPGATYPDVQWKGPMAASALTLARRAPLAAGLFSSLGTVALALRCQLGRPHLPELVPPRELARPESRAILCRAPKCPLRRGKKRSPAAGVRWGQVEEEPAA
jgi:hypothetical protein